MYPPDAATLRILDALDTWTLQEAIRINQEVLGGLKAGWERAVTESGKRGFRGVIRRKRVIVWRSEWVSPHSTPDYGLRTALEELKRMEFDAWKQEQGIK